MVKSLRLIDVEPIMMRAKQAAGTEKMNGNELG